MSLNILNLLHDTFLLFYLKIKTFIVNKMLFKRLFIFLLLKKENVNECLKDIGLRTILKIFYGKNDIVIKFFPMKVVLKIS